MHADPVCQCLTGCAVYGGVAFLAGRQALASATRARQGTQSLQRTRYAILAGLQLCDACAIMPFTPLRPRTPVSGRAGHSCTDGMGNDSHVSVSASSPTGGTVLASTSGYLLYLLATVFAGESCAWCLASATLSAGIFRFCCARVHQTVGPSSIFCPRMLAGVHGSPCRKRLYHAPSTPAL